MSPLTSLLLYLLFALASLPYVPPIYFTPGPMDAPRVPFHASELP